MMLPCLLVLVIVLLSAGASIRVATAYDVEAHKLIAEAAVENSALDKLLKSLGYPTGKDNKFKGISAMDWIKEGSRSEDKPDPRVVNHFHNPLAPRWSEAGLTAAGPWFSSVVWQQRPSQSSAPGYNGPGSWSWPDARGRYHKGLTLSSKADRETMFAELFRTLGQTMHFIQDASVPAHTRNDPHLQLEFLGIRLFDDPDPYEKWVDALAEDPQPFRAFLASRPLVRPAADIFGLPPISPRVDRQLAPAPVSALIDTGRYTGENPDVTETPAAGRPGIGLAEYSNANFLSKDTNSLNETRVTRAFPYPARASVELAPPGRDETQSEPEFRRYFRKVRHGDFVEFFAVPSALYNFLPDAFKDKKVGLDDLVLKDYAGKLLPRAVGYSAALLDYFFRGELEVQVTGMTQDGAGLHPAVRLANRTPGERLKGTLELYYDAVDGSRQRLNASWPLDLAVDAELDLGLLPAPRADKPPAEPGRYLLVYRGFVGDEPNAVIGKWANLSAVYVRQLATGFSCTRQPSNQFGACSETNDATGSFVVPDVEGILRGSGGISASNSQSRTIGGPLYPSDNPNFLFVNVTAGAFAEAYLYLPMGGTTLQLTVQQSATPFGSCGVLWGTLSGDLSTLTGSTFVDPPEFGRFLGFGGSSLDGVQTILVGPDAGPLLVNLSASTGTVPVTGTGTFGGSTVCDVVEARVLR
jgi:hypothetical protein